MDYLIDFERKRVIGDSRAPRFIVKDGPWCYKVFQRENEHEFTKERDLLSELRGCRHVSRMAASGEAVKCGKTYLCIKMQWSGETDLEAFLRDATQEDLSPKMAAALAAAILAPCVELEERGIRHNDLAPDNLICTDDGFDLIDLGAAISLEDIRDGKAGELELRGHERYNAPEKQDRRISPTSDIYSFGQILKDILARGKALGVRYPDEFLSFVSRCCAFEEADRFPSFRAALATLRPEPAPEEEKVEMGERPGQEREERPAGAAPIPARSPAGASADGAPGLRGTAPARNAGRPRRGPRPGRGRRALRAGGAVTALVLSLSFLVMETYLSFFRSWGDSPAERLAVERRSVPTDLALVLNDIINKNR